MIQKGWVALKNNLLGLDWITDPRLDKDVIYVIDPESLSIENGILKFKGKYIELAKKERQKVTEGKK